MDFEKSALKSKKFWAFLLCLGVLAGLAVTALLSQEIGWPLAAFMLAIVLTIGFLGVGFVFSVAQLDKYVRLAAITGRNSLDKDDGGSIEED